MKQYRTLSIVSIAVLLLLMGFIIVGTRLTSFAEKHLYFDQIIYQTQTQTPYQRLTLTRSNSNQDYRLFVDGHIQFSSKDEYRYHEALVHPVMSLPGRRDYILILGGGDGLAAREILKYADVKSIDLVDIDPEMTRLAKELPMLAALNQSSLYSEKVTVFNQDAFVFINAPGKRYDRVIIDMPDPHNETINFLLEKHSGASKKH